MIFIFQGLLKGLRWLGSQSYGSMYVNFGELISIRETLGSPLSAPYEDDRAFAQQVQGIGLRVVLAHQKTLVTPLFSAAASIILGRIAEGEKSISFPSLLHSIQHFRKLLMVQGM